MCSMLRQAQDHAGCADTVLWACSELHEHFPTVPEPIREYIEEVQKHLEAVTQYDGPDMSLEDKLNFLRETRHAFGRTALVLSGGGALGAFHIVSLFWMSLVSCLRPNGYMPSGHCGPCRILLIILKAALPHT